MAEARLIVHLAADRSQFTRGLKGAQTDIANFARAQSAAAANMNNMMRQGARLTAEMLTPMERYNMKLAELQNLLKASAISQETYNRAREQIVHPAVASALKEQAASIERRNRLMQRGAQITASLLTPTQRYNQQLRELKVLLQAGAITQETFQRAQMRAGQQTQVLTRNTQVLAVQQRAGRTGMNQLNQAAIQASYGVQDFAQVIGQPGMGLSGALRASVNNLSQVLMLFGGIKGAVIGTAATLGGMWVASLMESKTEAAKFREELEGVADALGRVERAANVRFELGRMRDPKDAQQQAERLGQELFGVGAARREAELRLEAFMAPNRGRREALQERFNINRGAMNQEEADKQIADLKREVGDLTRREAFLDKQLQDTLKRRVELRAAQPPGDMLGPLFEQGKKFGIEVKDAIMEGMGRIEKERQQVFEATRTPEERRVIEAERLKRLFPEGGEVFNRAMAMAGGATERNRGPVGGVGAVRADSSEAFSIIQAAIRQGMHGRQKDPAEQTAKFTKQAAQTLKAIDKKLGNQKDWDL